MTYIDPAAKLFGHLDRLLELRSGRTTAPINVEVDLTNRCSLGCEWCHFAYTHTRGPLAGKRAKPTGAVAGGDVMDPDLAVRLVEQFIDGGVRSVTWTGGGEPTLHPAFDRVVAAGAGRIAQGLYTHGGHIDRNRAALLKNALTFAYVSLDASNAFAYKRDKGVNRFTYACEGIRNLAEADGDATIGVGFLITSTNYTDAAEAADLAHDLGADYVQFRPTILYQQDHPDEADEDTLWMRVALDYLEEVAEEREGFVVLDRDRFRMYQDWSGHGYETCWWSGLQTVVTPNGKMWTCVNKREHAGAEVGDLSQETFSDVWARHRLEKVTGDCRVMCRGHLPNLALEAMLAPREHPEFV